mgnify:CR=1 FL=1
MVRERERERGRGRERWWWKRRKPIWLDKGSKFSLLSWETSNAVKQQERNLLLLWYTILCIFHPPQFSLLYLYLVSSVPKQAKLSYLSTPRVEGENTQHNSLCLQTHQSSLLLALLSLSHLLYSPFSPIVILISQQNPTKIPDSEPSQNPIYKQIVLFICLFLMTQT